MSDQLFSIGSGSCSGLSFFLRQQTQRNSHWIHSEAEASLRTGRLQSSSLFPIITRRIEAAHSPLRQGSIFLHHNHKKKSIKWKQNSFMISFESQITLQKILKIFLCFQDWRIVRGLTSENDYLASQYFSIISMAFLDLPDLDPDRYTVRISAHW